MAIGAVDGDQPYLLTDVADATRTPDGRIVLVEALTREIRVFASDGLHETTFGRRGDGPEEFGTAPLLALAAPDTLIVWDAAHHRLSRFNLSGVLLSQVTVRGRLDELSLAPFFNARQWQLVSDGALLWTGTVNAWVTREGSVPRMSRFVLLSEDATAVHDFGLFIRGEVWYTARAGGGLSGFQNPFGQFQAAALGTDPLRLAVSHPERWEITVYDAQGQVRNVMRGSFPRAALTQSMVAAERARRIPAGEGMGLTVRQSERAFERMARPDSVPAISRLMWDAGGSLWVGQRTGDVRTVGEFQILDPNGRWLGSVVLPPEVDELLEIGDDYVLAVARDDLDVQYLRQYGLERHH